MYKDKSELFAALERTKKMNLNRALMHLSEREAFGISAIQRACRIGYNNARSVAELGVREGLLSEVNDYQFTVTVAGKERSDAIKNL